MAKDYWVECNVCKQRLKNWVGSTPCCGSIAFMINDEGTISKKVSLYTSVGAAIIDFSEQKMEKSEIKKALYKEKPIAKITGLYRDGGSKDYETTLSTGEVVKFYVPIQEQRGSTGILPEFQVNEIPAQLLIRWIKD